MATPRYDQYLSRLPLGLNSYPEAQQRASMLRARLAESDLASRLADVPQGIVDLITSPPGPSAWVSEVKAHALLLCIGDLCCHSDEAFEALTERVNRRVLGGPIFSMLFRMLGPMRVTRGVSRRWEQLHRGTLFRLVESSNEKCVARLEAPAHLMPPEIVRHYAIALRVGLELAGGDQASVTCETLDPRKTLFVARWV